ncbi:hypothetical protein FQN55_004483 [Onygenales sp. PD_40]|nr:hypothetical protein FQN55_004483 [Onygenales sp. PD_40]
MSATTATLPSPGTWSPGVGPNPSTTPLGMPPRTPSSVGQITAPMLGAGTLSPTFFRDSCANNYFGIVEYTSSNPPNSSPVIHTRKSWNFPSASPNPVHSNRNFTEPNTEFEAFRKQVESVGYIAGHRVSSSFEKQTQTLRELDRKSEERRDRDSPVSPGTAELSWDWRKRDDDGGRRMNIDLPQNSSISGLRSASPHINSCNVSTPHSSNTPLPRLIAPSRMLEGDARSPRFALPTHSSRNSLSVNRSRTLQRSETSPAAVDPGAVTFITGRVCTDILKSSPDTTLLLDVRPYPQFSQARIKGALNLCIPTTLLKRPSFNLAKVEDTFTDEAERKRFTRWRLSTRIIVYDSATSHMKDASTLINVLKKFTGERWSGEPLILRGGFSQFSAEFPDFVEENTISESSNFIGQQRSISLALPKPSCISGGCSIPKSTMPVHPFFANIRQNTDLIGGVGQIPIKLPQAITGKAQEVLPQWLYRASDAKDNGKLVSDRFLEIEKAEQQRMQEALSGNVSYGPPESDSPQKAFRIAGLEKGAKNRYNNIYPYDHSRVRLQGVSAGNCDYVNANYIQASRSNKKYIATQAPIPATFNDFWRVIWEQDVRVIVMLTAESEGAQVKCHSYWKAADYGPFIVKTAAERRIPLDVATQPPSPSQARRPSQRRLTNPLTAGEKLDAQREQQSPTEAPFVIVRHLTLAHSAFPFQPIREITQLQYSHWPDFGTPAEPIHLIRLIEECNKIANTANGRASRAGSIEPEPEGQRQILVHCSAGCGRTGTFCTVDSVIDMLKRQRCESADQTKSTDWVHRDDIDLIAATVEDFRLQRLSMVQSLKQFVLCYESVIEWIASSEPEFSTVDRRLLGSAGDNRSIARRSYHE